MRAQEFVIETDEPTRIKLGSSDPAARAWIDRVYQLYPQTFQNNHVMPLGGSGDDQEFAMFELVPSLSRRGAVEVKWFQAYPLRQGVGSRAMQQLQHLAREDGISLTLFPWDKGQVSQSKLTKFYRGQGFSPAQKGSKTMQWTPDQPGVAESWGVSKEPIPLPIGDYLASGSDEFAPPGNYQSAEDLQDEVYDQIDAGVEPQVVTVDPRRLLATQDWLSNAGGDDPLFDEYPDRPVVYQKAGKLYILDGHHRTTRAWRAGRPIAVYLFSDKNLSENFADGKKPGRKGLSKRVGIPKKASLSQLQKIASSSTGERRRMAQWQLNMRRGRNKKK
jgi:hypothetical protein